MEQELLEIIHKEGYNFITNPKTIFVPIGTEESDLGKSLTSLRDGYGYMIQTEIT